MLKSHCIQQFGSFPGCANVALVFSFSECATAQAPWSAGLAGACRIHSAIRLMQAWLNACQQMSTLQRIIMEGYLHCTLDIVKSTPVLSCITRQWPQSFTVPSGMTPTSANTMSRRVISWLVQAFAAAVQGLLQDKARALQGLPRAVEDRRRGDAAALAHRAEPMIHPALCTSLHLTLAEPPATAFMPRLTLLEVVVHTEKLRVSNPY